MGEFAMAEAGWLRWGMVGALVLEMGLGILFPSVRAQAPAETPGSQLIPRTKEEREQLFRTEHRIFLNVSVTDASGNAAAGLKPEDFTVLDKGQPRQIVGFRAVDGTDAGAQVHGTLVVDGINSQYAMARVKKDLEKFFSASRGPLPFPLTLAVLSDNGVTEGSPSTDRGALASQLTEMTKHIKGLDCDASQLGSDLESRIGGTPANNAPAQNKDDCNNQKFVYSLNLLEKLAEDPQNAKGRGLLIWIGPGWRVPEAADSGQIMPSWRTFLNYGEVISDLRTDLREADVILDAVTWSDFAHAKGVRMADEGAPGVPSSAAALALPVLVRDTGGQAIDKTKSLGDAINACLADGTRFYMLAFDSVPSSAPDEFHPIEVKVDKPGATVRTATAYYAQP